MSYKVISYKLGVLSWLTPEKQFLVKIKSEVIFLHFTKKVIKFKVFASKLTTYNSSLRHKFSFLLLKFRFFESLHATFLVKNCFFIKFSLNLAFRFTFLQDIVQFFLPMKIINPIYDQAFKYMMDNETVAKKVLSIILETEVLSVSDKATEQALLEKRRQIPLSRFDFKAIIKTQDEGERTVLIEIQKSKDPDPVIRFRRYLGKNYIRTETFINENGEEEKRPLPIITIYFLGYNLSEYETPGVWVNNSVIDAISKKELHKKSEFVNLLTHPSYILQINRLKPERRTKLEKFLSFFDQSRKDKEDKYIIDADETLMDEFPEIFKHLNRGTLDEQLIENMIAEEEIDKAFTKIETQLEQAQKREKQAKQREKQAQEKLAKKMLKYNEPITEIMQETGLSKAEIEKIKNKM